VREAELLASSNIFGVNKVHFLRFHDGELCNNNYHLISDQVGKILREVKPDTVMTFNQNGVSGHIDHITVSMVATFLFERLKFIRQIMYFSNVDKVKKLIGKKYFVYFPEGISEENADLVLELVKIWKVKRKAMQAHKSQIKDYSLMITLFRKYLKKELFKISVKN
jgi:LmbE family N-acetylglucosaminyl deacetylase